VDRRRSFASERNRGTAKDGLRLPKHDVRQSKQKILNVAQDLRLDTEVPPYILLD
jgi:hypothetical protein